MVLVLGILRKGSTVSRCGFANVRRLEFLRTCWKGRSVSGCPLTPNGSPLLEAEQSRLADVEVTIGLGLEIDSQGCSILLGRRFDAPTFDTLFYKFLNAIGDIGERTCCHRVLFYVANTLL